MRTLRTARGGGQHDIARFGLTRTPADMTALVTALGGDSAVVGLYDRRTGGSAASATDTRASGGPPLVATGTVAFDSVTGWTFDGVTGFLRNAVAGRLAELTGACGIAVVCTVPDTAGASEVLSELSIDGTTSSVVLYRNATNGTLVVQAASSAAQIATPGTGTRVLHARRLLATTNIIAGIQAGSGVEVTATAAGSYNTVGRFTVGAGRNTANFSDVVVKAIVIYSGDYAGKQATVNAWAAANHGATL